MATKGEVLRVWAMLCAAYPTFARDSAPDALQQTLHVYQQILADVPADVLEATALQHIASSKFFPTVAELRTIAVTLAAPQFPTPMEAWGEVVRARGRWCRYDSNGNPPSPEYSHAIIARIVRDMGGMIYLQDSENETADRARFLEAYQTLVRREQEDAMLLPVVRDLAARLTAGRNGGQKSLPA